MKRLVQSRLRKRLLRLAPFFGYHHFAFAKRRLIARQEFSAGSALLLNHNYIFKRFNNTGVRATSFAWSHGADKLSYLGTGILYFALAYMLKARTCVCIGSGGGFVPRLMYQGQRDAGIKDGRTILIDADLGNMGRPDYLDPGSRFRKDFPAIEIINAQSAIYAVQAQRAGLEIDYLHIDGDHSYEGALADFTNYLPLMNPNGIITFHDTDGDLPCAGVLEEVERRGHRIVNFGLAGAGVALVCPQRWLSLIPHQGCTALA